MEERSYGARFRLILAALFGIGTGAVLAAVVLVAGGGPAPAPRWSLWQPSKDAEGGPQQIANHVGSTYRLDNGNQLVAVQGGPLEIAGRPARIAVNSGATGGDVSFLEGEGALYALCGLGPDCSIKSGKPSHRRHLLVRREALELALYTFRYVKDVDLVAALLPPAKGKRPEHVMVFRKQELEPALDRPLSHTLPGPPPKVKDIGSAEVDTLERLTAGSLFEFEVQPAQDASVVLLIKKPE
jgi:hypothetical protein